MTWNAKSATKKKSSKKLDNQIKEAKKQLERLENLLRKLGIEPSGNRLYINENVILTPIIINDNDDDNDDDGDDDGDDNSTRM